MKTIITLVCVVVIPLATFALPKERVKVRLILQDNGETLADEERNL